MKKIVTWLWFPIAIVFAHFVGYNITLIGMGVVIILSLKSIDDDIYKIYEIVKEINEKSLIE